jgi:phosphoribosylformylglycinamidine synthase
MKAKITVTPKKAVLDPQGKTVQTALEQIGFTGIKDVRIGKIYRDRTGSTDREAALKSISQASHKILSNPVIEDYSVEIE